MHKPWHSLVFGCLVFLILGLLSFTFPRAGLEVAPGLALSFPDLNTLFSTEPVKKDISMILKAVDEIDTTFAIQEGDHRAQKDSLDRGEEEAVTSPADPVPGEEPDPGYNKEDTVTKLNTGIQTRSKQVLYPFFEALYALKKNPEAIRVLHYGDSQIEGDRITDYLRLKLQGQFGGHGPGLISLMPIANSLINKVTTGPGWDRYNVFTSKDKRVTHNNYGVLAGFTRFSNYKPLSDTSAVLSSSLMVTTTRLGGANAMAYQTLKLFYGGARRKTWCEFYDGPALMAADSLEAGGILRVKEYSVGNGAYTHSLKFKGQDSPDFYAISLESDRGVMVDNIALRGSSGTFFHHINNAQLKQFYDYLNVKLIILQFGGNALPAIRDPDMAVNYSNYIKHQISLLKKMVPGASIIFIGPSDMSMKSGTDYITYPYLEPMRDALKRAVLESGCAFYDMYDAMGGRNSMASWVDQKLAASDYIHFSPQGARKIATLFYAELIKEYNLFLKTKH